jgi:hypothetical protein
VVVASGLFEAELCAPERCAELGDEFFGAVAAIAEPAGQVASETGGVPGAVGVLVCAGGVELRPS